MKINIIGSGNVATHLEKALSGKAAITTVNPRTLSGIDQNADLTLISVTDTAIPSVLTSLTAGNRSIKGVVAHTSGSTSINIFSQFPIENYGVFYPLQTFSKDKELCYAEIPFFIEGSNINAENVLKICAEMISRNVSFADSIKRKRLHIAAVLSCNFVNHLWALSDEYLKEANLDFLCLIPLIEETLNKVKKIPPLKAQTGPAVRKDEKIIKEHLTALEEYPDIKEIYALMSESIKGK